VNVVIIAPHPDDEAIGCGGTALRHADRGDRVVTVFLTSGELGLKSFPIDEARQTREGEARSAAAVLGATDCHFLRLADWGCDDQIELAASLLHAILDAERPGIVYLPHPADDHPDHRASLPIVQRALERPGFVPELRGYEVWSPLASHDLVEDISAVFDRKMAGIAAYKSQLAQFRYDRAAEGLNRYRGALAGRCDYAEVFAVLEAAPGRVRDH